MTTENAKLYSEEEIGAILKRTAELSKSRESDHRSGLSLDELKHLAAEAGLNPDHVVRAAVELTGSRPSEVSGDVFGGPLRYSTEIDLGVAVSQESWEKMLPLIRTAFDNSGVVQQRTDVREWTGSGRSRSHVSIYDTPRGSRLSLFWSDTVSAVPMFIPTIMAAAISLPILFEELSLGLIGIPVYILIVSFFFMMSRFAVTLVKKKQTDKIETLGKELSRLALDNEVAFEHEVISDILVHDRDVGRKDANKSGKNESDTQKLEIPSDEYKSEESGPKNAGKDHAS